MDMELKSLLYVVLKNQCRILAKLEKISTDVQDEGLNNLEDPYVQNLRKRMQENEENIMMLLFKESILETKVIQCENLEF